LLNEFGGNHDSGNQNDSIASGERGWLFGSFTVMLLRTLEQVVGE
jgi:hypothetical protein